MILAGMIDKTTVFQIARMFRFQWEQAQNCYVVLYPEGMVTLSGSAGEIMKRIDGVRSVNEIITHISESFDGADVEKDVVTFLEVAHENGWIGAKQSV